MKNAICWFEIYVNDMERAKNFYEKVFNVNLIKPEQMDDTEMWLFDGDDKEYGSHGALVKMEGFKPGNGGTLVYFTCDDCLVEEGRAVEAGGKVHQSKMSIGPHGNISLIHDTEGNMIGLHSIN